MGVVPVLVKRMLDKGMFLFGFINLLGDLGAKQVDELTAFQNKQVKLACDKFRIRYCSPLPCFVNASVRYNPVSIPVLWFEYKLVQVEPSFPLLSLNAEFELDNIKKLSVDYAKTKELAFAEASQIVDVEDAKHIIQNDKLLGDRVEDIVKEWDAQKEEFYEKTGVSRHGELAVVGNDESGVFHHENDGFDEITQQLLE